ncbi:cation transporter [Rhizobium sp. Root708]|uniref:TonB-dependent hemoglobin/transferrin/lactoferrin family receptor n=1 Tax=Rhizobium sp. Root708 TaxID=1736592 RepID=UPI0006F5DCC2|nr:TonB-dependent hemoglobin/transferrin/lactoferrin family receptor [Rhizobium sp. Root708]KRB50804.1 cation transporter [Rhizobium sp. Root708]
MVIRHWRSALAVSAAVLVFPVAQALAQSAESAPAAEGGTPLQKIVVKGKRVVADDPAANNPLASQTTADEIAKKEINDIKDLGNTTEPGVDYVASRPGQPGGLFIRGLGGPRITTLVDNIPIPFLSNDARIGSMSPTTGISDGNDSYDLSSLSTIDVLRGADSSRIGSGALGGALVLRTLEPEDLIGEGRDWGGVAKLTFDGDNDSLGGSVAVAKRIQDTSILFQGGLKRGHEEKNQGDVGGVYTTRTEANPADFDQNNLLFKLRQDLEGGHRIGFTAERFDVQTDTVLKTLANPTLYTPDAYTGFDNTRRERVSLDYDYEAPDADSLIDSASLKLYWQKLYKGSGSQGTRISGVQYLRDNEMEEGSFGITGGAISQFDTGYIDHELRFGGLASISNTTSYLTARPASIVTFSQADMPDVDGGKVGLYVEDEMKFGDSGFALTPGTRFDWYNYDPKISEGFRENAGLALFGMQPSQDGVRLSPKLLATYDLTPEVQLFAQWAMGFRAPTVNELYINFSNPPSGYAYLGNPYLKPETSQGFEIGATYNSNDLTAKLTLFHNKYKNFIDNTDPVVDPVSGLNVTTFYNRAHVNISGVEAKARKEFANGFNMSGSLAYAYGKDEDTDELIPTVAPFKAIVGVGYAAETWGTDLAFIGAAAVSDRSSASFKPPGYGTMNLTGWWEPEQVKGMRVQAGVYNIFDKTYYDAIAVRDAITQPREYYSETGRTFKISLTQRF